MLLIIALYYQTKIPINFWLYIFFLESFNLWRPLLIITLHYQKKNIIEDKIFTPYGFISLATRTTSILSWILGKSLLNNKEPIFTQKKKASKPMVQAHNTSSYFWLLIQAHESYRENFGSRGLEGQEVCSIKLQWFKVDKGKPVAWHVFLNSLNSDKSVCNR